MGEQIAYASVAAAGHGTNQPDQSAKPSVCQTWTLPYATPVAMAEALHRGIKGSTLTVLKNGRHLTPLEMPERISAELLRLTEIAVVR